MEEKKLIWGEIECPGYAVCIGQKGSSSRPLNYIYKITKYVSDELYYNNTARTVRDDKSDWRQATPEEVNWHLLDPLNNLDVTKMPKEVRLNSFPIY